jgi:hydroxymethylpyrimidine pyrophosphatase-like HAD family hydrolase
MLQKKTIKLLVEGVLNKMIPKDNFIKINTSEIVNVDKFIKIINKKKILKKEIHQINNLIKKSKNNNYQYLVNKILQSRIVENEIQEQLLEDYFTSKKVIKILENKTKIFFKKYKKENINNLLRFVKKN